MRCSVRYSKSLSVAPAAMRSTRSWGYPAAALAVSRAAVVQRAQSRLRSRPSSRCARAIMVQPFGIGPVVRFQYGAFILSPPFSESVIVCLLHQNADHRFYRLRRSCRQDGRREI
jgi:hypothetical protein